ncbi:TetR/AcrR family transcriptional regulator [Burkholderia cepacia]|uniref:TetR/AcrR family transcriptional regulator n=1 Tax=Burkholderia cepacia TaxID=292 RepID=UPI0016397AF0|nr:TetR/AcrR family transcriptional regulator [Burkholderia cepacia]
MIPGTTTRKDDAPAGKLPRTKPAEVRLEELMAAAETLFLAQRYTASFLDRSQHAVDACDADDWLARLRAWIRTNIETYAATYRTHDIVYANHHHHDRANADKNAILEQLGAILDGGAQAGTWRLAHPQVTALLIYAGVHGATDHIIAAPETDRAAFVDAVVDDCLRMLGVGT